MILDYRSFGDFIKSKTVKPFHLVNDVDKLVAVKWCEINGIVLNISKRQMSALHQNYSVKFAI